MIVSQAEIEFVTKGRCRLLLLPVERGELGELLPCPVGAGELIRLQPKQFAKGVKVTATSVQACDGPSEVAAASVNPRRAKGSVWCVEFVLGDHTGFFAKHQEKYLKRTGIGLTTNPGRAVPGEPAVTSAEQLEIARRARLKRELEQRQRWQANRQGMLALLADMRAAGVLEQDIRFIERRIAKIDRHHSEQAA